jgi:hypothetical protein
MVKLAHSDKAIRDHEKRSHRNIFDWLQQTLGPLTHGFALLLSTSVTSTAALTYLCWPGGLCDLNIPYNTSSSLVRLQGRQQQIDNIPFAGPDLLALRTQLRETATLAAYDNNALFAGDTGDGIHRIRGAAVSPGFLGLLGISPEFGSDFRKTANLYSDERAVLLSYGWWHQQWHSNRTVLGSSIILNGERLRIIGVLPSTFWFPGMQDCRLLVPLWEHPLESNAGDVTRRDQRWLKVVGRIANGQSPVAVQNNVSMVAKRMAAEHPDSNRRLEWQLERFTDWIHRDFNRVSGELMFICLWSGTVGFSVFVSVALRLTLYPSVASLEGVACGQLEPHRGLVAFRRIAIMWTFMGHVSGILAGLSLARLLPAGPLCSGLCNGMGLGWFVAVLALGQAGIYIVVVLLSDSAIRKRLSGLVGPIRCGGYSRGSALVVFIQFCTSLVFCLLCVDEYLRIVHATALDPGFGLGDVLTMEVQPALPGSSGATQPWAVTLNCVMSDVRSVRQVKEIGASRFIPFNGLHGNGRFRVSAQQPDAGWNGPPAESNEVSPGYFAAMKIPLMRGRAFNNRDSPASDHVVIVSSSLESDYFGNEPAVGRDLSLEGEDEHLRIIGVAGDIRRMSLFVKAPYYIYRPLTITDKQAVYLSVRLAGDATNVSNEILRVIHARHASVVVSNVSTMLERVTESLARLRFDCRFLGSAAIIHLLLAFVSSVSLYVIGSE